MSKIEKISKAIGAQALPVGIKDEIKMVALTMRSTIPSASHPGNLIHPKTARISEIELHQLHNSGHKTTTAALNPITIVKENRGRIKKSINIHRIQRLHSKPAPFCNGSIPRHAAAKQRKPNITSRQLQRRNRLTGAHGLLQRHLQHQESIATSSRAFQTHSRTLGTYMEDAAHNTNTICQ
ncbi:hypothetical protein Nepgr_033738 [Nepenthes gracilis]|uniref:Uncharacterized protein n=1 Tax=Nepenthes gracilis TaxID=150966 RepID=A0AAD3TMK9_NEPGR|nr:hypothetical protein Nepgr_033738 [Nepenthes gracilis]